ncbi:MAG: recombinase family protein [Sedimenticola sp.]
MYIDDKPKIKDVFLYLRKSTREEDERQIRSIHDQRSECIAMAERFDLNVVEEFVEDRSARKPNNRPELKRMLKELSYRSPERRRADGILAWHPDRLSRNALEAGQIIQMVDDELVKDLFFPAYAFHNSISGIEHLTSEFARAKGYTDRLAHVVKRGVHNREKEGAMIYPVKFGYEKRRESENPAKCSLFPVPHSQFFSVAKRMFELAAEGASLDTIHHTLKKEYTHLGNLPISVSTINRNLNDSFYCGLWTIKTGTKDERVINMKEIVLPDQTTFTPILSISEFHYLQKLRNAKIALANLPRKRSNPLPRLVHCEYCERLMYPNYRKIKKAGGLIEEQLGFECQGKKSNGRRCPQKRIKATDIFSKIEAELLDRAPGINKREYLCVLYASQKFIKKVATRKRQEGMQTTQAIKKHLSTKQKLIEQKAELVAAGEYDDVTREYIDSQLNNTHEQLIILNERKKDSENMVKNKIITFKKFLELMLNLHQYWDIADFKKKGEISAKLVSNLVVRDAKIRSMSWITPFSDHLKNHDLLGGRPQSKELEPSFECLWKGIPSDGGNSHVTRLHQLLIGIAKPIYPILVQ